MSKQNNPPPWSGAPAWAMWRAQTKRGVWWWEEGEPSPCHDFYKCLDPEKRRRFAKQGAPNPNWQATLEKRPE
ncbi:MAG: hypothetical protein EKK63_18365 [Acinetobacter sp.]|uniref:hypothetical protein n=1 Tax=Acinetobacter sp. TaxID=472 RepID=UPI000FB7B239|nr:hypothetical protein [Acinetobacter sp.]RUP36126.1 MAG: hypothetical protein EKK63_18365 [Acinetobacter sp.]